MEIIFRGNEVDTLILFDYVIQNGSSSLCFRDRKYEFGKLSLEQLIGNLGHLLSFTNRVLTVKVLSSLIKDHDDITYNDISFPFSSISTGVSHRGFGV